MTQLIIALILCGATVIYWYWAFQGRQEVTKSNKEIHYLVFVGSLIGVGIFLYGGFDLILFFIPDSWGSVNEDGDWISTKNYFACFLAMAASLFIHLRPHQVVRFFKSKED